MAAFISDVIIGHTGGCFDADNVQAAVNDAVSLYAGTHVMVPITYMLTINVNSDTQELDIIFDVSRYCIPIECRQQLGSRVGQCIIPAKSVWADHHSFNVRMSTADGQSISFRNDVYIVPNGYEHVDMRILGLGQAGDARLILSARYFHSVMRANSYVFSADAESFAIAEQVHKDLLSLGKKYKHENMIGCCTVEGMIDYDYITTYDRLAHHVFGSIAA